MSKAISPNELRMKVVKMLPPVVINAVNSLIEDKLRQATNPLTQHMITFERDELIKAIIKQSRKENTGDYREGGDILTEKQIVANGYLDVRDTYQVQGWEIWTNETTGQYTFVFPK